MSNTRHRHVFVCVSDGLGLMGFALNCYLWYLYYYMCFYKGSLYPVISVVENHQNQSDAFSK